LLVVTDYAGNLQRIEKIIDSIDQPSGTEPIVIPLQYASALDVVQTVNRLFGESPQMQGATGTDPNQRFTVVADPSYNSMLARSADPSRLARLRQLADMLDTPTSAGGNIHVVYLRSAEAVKLAETLRAIYHGEMAPAASAAARTTPASGLTPRPRPRMPRPVLLCPHTGSSRPMPPPTQSSSPRPTRSTTICGP
jgi:general secretion pathway protein D